MAAESGATLLLQFAREPVAGAVKTRMLPHLDAVQARQLHCDLVRWTARRLVASGLGPVVLVVAGDEEHELFAECVKLGVSGLAGQRGSDLGQRMFTALEDALEHFERVLLVGSDCPFIDSAYLRSAVSALDRVPVVLGPAADGGYVLIGVRHVDRRLFMDVPWGQDDVLSRTRERLGELGWEFEELPVLADVDRPDDLPAWEALKRREA